MGAYVMKTLFQTSCISSGMFITAMAANPLAVDLARESLGATIRHAPECCVFRAHACGTAASVFAVDLACNSFGATMEHAHHLPQCPCFLHATPVWWTWRDFLKWCQRTQSMEDCNAHVVKCIVCGDVMSQIWRASCMVPPAYTHESLLPLLSFYTCGLRLRLWRCCISCAAVPAVLAPVLDCCSWRLVSARPAGAGHRAPGVGAGDQAWKALVDLLSSYGAVAGPRRALAGLVPGTMCLVVMHASAC